MTQPGPNKGTNARYKKSDNLESSSLAGKSILSIRNPVWSQHRCILLLKSKSSINLLKCI